MKKEHILYFLFLFISISYVNVFAGSISSNYGIVTVDNLKIGGSYSMTELANFPLRAEYRSDYAADITITPFIPKRESLLAGYEPIPDLAWIKLTNDRFAVGAGGGVALTDVIVTVPDDEKYMGKSYQIMFKITATPRYRVEKGIGVVIASALDSCLLVSILDRPPTPEEKEKLEKKLLKGNLGFELKPQYIYLTGLELGKRYHNKKEESIKIINTSDEKVKIVVKSVIPKDVAQRLPEGYEYTKNPEFLQSKKQIITLKPDSVERIDFSVLIPNKEEYRDKKYLFIIEASSIELPVTVSYSSKVFVTVK